MRREIKWLPIISLAASCLLLLPVFIYPTDWAGWLFVYVTFAIPFFFERVRRDRQLLLIILGITAIHNIISIYNAYGATIFGASVDAVRLQELSRDLATDKLPLWFTEFDALEIGVNVYTRFLASFYRVFGVSLLLGQSLSVLAYILSCITLVYLAGVFRFRFKRELLIIYGVSAPAIIYCSIVMREAWQILFFLLVVYLTIRLRIAPSILKTILMVCCGLILGLLHNGLFIYSFFLLGASLYWGMSGKWRKAGYKKILIRGTILGIAVVGMTAWIYFGGEIGGATKAIRTGDAGAYAETYREKGDQDAAANYQVAVDTSSLLNFALTGSVAFFYYQFAPFPWQVTRAMDIYASLEGMLRLAMILYMLRMWWRARGERRQRYGYLIVCYFSLEFLWALGTGNWGTAVRHHIIAYGILVLLGAPSLIYNLNRIFRRLRYRGKKRFQPKRYEARVIRAIN